MNKTIPALLAVVAAGAGAFGIIEMNQAADRQALIDQLQARLQQEEQARLQAEREKSQAAEELKLAEENVARLKKERDEAKKSVASVERAPDGAAAAPGDNADSRPQDALRGLLQGFAKRMDDPTVRQAMKSNQERAINGAYAALFQKLGLDEATSQLTVDLIANRNMIALDKARKLMDGSASGDEALTAVRKEVEAVKTDYDGKLRAVLGEQRFNEFTSHEQGIGDQRSLDSISRNLDRKGAPLQPEQRDALANIMREERAKYPSTEIPDIGGGPGMALLMSDAEATERQQRQTEIDNAVLSRAGQAGLSPDQVNALGDSFKQRQNQQAMSRTMGRIFLGGGNQR